MTTLLRLPSGTVIDGWHVLRELGDGGSAVVYLVQKNGQLRALKVARHRDASGDDMQTHARAMRELTVLLLLMEQGHPNIIKPLGYGYAEAGNMYIALEYVEGWTLGEWQEKKHPTVHEILGVFVKIASALRYMHSKGILHRDLKLSNVLIRKSDGEPILIDFSCATHTQAAELTQSGLPPGTDRFRAPEQFQFLREHRDEHRARYAFQVADELFTVGAMLYELLTDPRPTETRPRESLNNPFAPPSPVRELNARIPEALSDLVDDLLSRDPTRRPVDTAALHRELTGLHADPGAEYGEPAHPPSAQRQPRLPAGRAVARAHRSGKVLAAGGAAFMLAAVVALWSRSDAPEPPTAPRATGTSSLFRVEPSGPPAPDMSPATAPGVGTEPVPVPEQKEGSTVKTPPPEDPKPARRQKPAPGSDLRKVVPLTCALAAGCTGPQVRPEPFTCPEGAVATRKQLRWGESQHFKVVADDRYARLEDVWLRAGDTVVGVVPDAILPEQREVAPPGTRFFGGKVYVVPGETKTGKPGQVFVRYDRVKLPRQDELPVCFIIDLGADEVKDGAARIFNSTTGSPVDYWP
ncbi:serine/threonine protein kinase [Hyalangium minutum]|uniref:non-specific serine/threonine protein kinase n=1 Tax=Hyalangium minutum TaxID=394096 RepID=A0A085WXW2_9BACT|nr:serine/threonine-protein kinase [Hyalangium minutum]KFE72525.1 Serine/threonine protein kinase [Hyalangium minutum]